jgi:hypothetical protein
MIGPRGRIRTLNLPVLSGTPLLVGLTRRKWRSRQDSRLQPPRSKRGALYIELREHAGADGETRTLVGRGARQFTKLLLSLLSHVGEMVGCHGAAPCSAV